MTNRQAARSEKNCCFGFVSVPTLECVLNVFCRRGVAVPELGEHGRHLYIRENTHSARTLSLESSPEAMQRHMQAFSDSKLHVRSIGPPCGGAELVMNSWGIAHFSSPAYVSRLSCVPHSSFFLLAPSPYSQKC